jgi:hypothetical protein
MDVYEIYWNIKFNHGMESINNNFRMEEEAEMIGWMAKGRIIESMLMLCKEITWGLWSKPHKRAKRNINIVEKSFMTMRLGNNGRKERKEHELQVHSQT